MIVITADSDLPTILLWIIEHQGIIEERWLTQFRWNKERLNFEEGLTEKLNSITTMMHKLQGRIMFIAGGSAMLGACIPVFFKYVFVD